MLGTEPESSERRKFSETLSHLFGPQNCFFERLQIHFVLVPHISCLWLVVYLYVTVIATSCVNIGGKKKKKKWCVFIAIYFKKLKMVESRDTA